MPLKDRFAAWTDALKFGAVGLFVVGLVGYPAVAWQRYDAGLPAADIPNDLVVRAGILPGLTIVVVGVWAVRVWRRLEDEADDSLFSWVDWLVAKPVLALWSLVALTALLLGGIAEESRRFAGEVQSRFGWQLSPGMATILLFVYVLLVFGMIVLVAAWSGRVLLPRLVKFLERFKTTPTQAPQATTTVRARRAILTSWWRQPLACFVAALLMASGVWYGFQRFDLFTSYYGLQVRLPILVGTLWCFATTFTAVFTLTTKWWARSDFRRLRRYAAWNAALLGATVVILSIGAYTVWIYPRLPQALGGGAPHSVRLCMEARSIPSALRHRLGFSRPAAGPDALIECSDTPLSIVPGPRDVLSIADVTGGRAGVQLDRSLAKMLIWGGATDARQVSSHPASSEPPDTASDER